MTDTQTNDPAQSIERSFRKALAHRFSLKDDQAEPEDIDRSIREGVHFKGTNLWVLMLAIFIASIGLNVNSTAVIIGAMLISPLMGPIMGVGYGVGIYDFELIRRSLKNLGIAILIGLFTSTLYFLVSPLTSAQSELLARTTPTIWDVLIAMFGGLAGIIGATRKEKSNIVPGVAIATALMPPLCTAGYGIATGEIHYFLGAFYLFFINTIFIAFSTLLVVAYLDLPHKRFVSAEVALKTHRIILAVVLVTVIPSLYLAYGFVKSEIFRQKADTFIKKEFVFESSYVVKQTISPGTSEIAISLAGNHVSEEKLATIESKLSYYGLEHAKLITHQSDSSIPDFSSLKSDLLKDVLGSSQQSIEDKNKRIVALEQELAAAKSVRVDRQLVVKELYAQYPSLTKIVLSETPIFESDGTVKFNTLLLGVSGKPTLSKQDRQRIISWLKIRMGDEKINSGSEPQQTNDVRILLFDLP